MDKNWENKSDLLSIIDNIAIANGNFDISTKDIS